MSILHTVNKSPFEKTSLATCLGYASAGSAVLMIEDGVFGAIKGTSVENMISGADGVEFYVLGPDLNARGLSEDRLIDGVKVVDYAGFVDLSTQKDKVQNWL